MTIFVSIITIPLDLIVRKQKQKANEERKKIEDLKKGENISQEKMADELYDFYKSNNYNPFFATFKNILVFILNFSILFALVGVFSPVKNFSGFDKSFSREMVRSYQDEYEVDTYPEIEMLQNLDKVAQLEVNGITITNEEISKLIDIRESFMIGNFDTTTIPVKSQNKLYLILPIMLLVLSLCSNLSSFAGWKKKNKAQKIITLLFSILGIEITCTIAFDAPIIVCIYMIIMNISSSIKNKILQNNAFQKKNKQDVTKGDNI